jgi:hypothetical protein
MQLPIPSEHWTDFRARLIDGLNQLSSYRVLAGFDGFVDNIHRVVRHKENGQPIWMETTADWGRYVLDKQGSFSMETILQATRIGGNMPLMAGALAALGTRTRAIGALGWPVPHPAFDKWRANIESISFASPGSSEAYEFSDGKIMMADMGELNSAGWALLLSRTKAEDLHRFCSEADLLCFLNWSELDASHDIWEGCWKDLLEKDPGISQKMLFTDLSDFSKRTNEELNRLLSLLKRINQSAKWILGLNKNEARLLYRFLKGKGPNGIEDVINEIYEQLAPWCLVLHEARYSTCLHKGTLKEVPSFHLAQPLTLTGAGDHFSAGFCAGLLMKFSIEECLLLGNSVAGFLVTHGYSPAAAELVSFLDQKFFKPADA